MVIDFRNLTLLPSMMIFVLTVRMCISLASNDMTRLSYMVLALSLLSLGVMSLLFVRESKMRLFMLLGIVFFMILVGITVMNAGDIKSCFYLACDCTLMLFLMDYYKERFDMVLAAFTIGLSFCVYIGFFHMMSHPQLWISDMAKDSQGYLLGGNYNQIGCRLLCAVATCMCSNRLGKIWVVNTVGVVLASLVMLLIVRSMTSLSSMLAFLALCAIPSKRLQRIGIISLFVFYLLFQFLVCFQGKGLENNELAVYLIVDVLGKDITFTYRTDIWDAAARAFAQSPLIGYGYVDADWYFSNMYAQALGPHNFMWQMLIHGGLLLFALFAAMFYVGVKDIFLLSDRTVNVILIAIALLLLMMTMEAYPYIFIIYLLALAYYYPYLETCFARPKKQEAS